MNGNEIIKPVTLLKEDFSRNLIELCNNSGLPLFVIEYILRDVYMEVKELAKRQYETDLEKYNSNLQELKQSMMENNKDDANE